MTRHIAKDGIDYINDLALETGVIDVVSETEEKVPSHSGVCCLSSLTALRESGRPFVRQPRSMREELMMAGSGDIL